MAENDDTNDESDSSDKKLFEGIKAVEATEFDFDDYLKTTLGEFGRYQQFIVWFLCIPACFLSAYSTLDLVFMAYTPPHSCNVTAAETPNRWLNSSSELSSEMTIVGKQCEYVYYYQNGSQQNASFVEECRSWKYDRQYFDQTIVTQWNLVCDQAITARTILSLLNIATLLAAGYSYIQDRWGRKRAFLLNLTIFLAGTCSSLLAPTPLTFAVLKFVGGITCMWEICYCWALEFVGPSQRTALTTMLSVIYGVATLSLALVAYLCRTWVEIGLLTSAPFILLYSYAYFMPESPRWLLSQGRVDEALVIMESMAKWHRVKIDTLALKDKILGQCQQQQVDKGAFLAINGEKEKIDATTGRLLSSASSTATLSTASSNATITTLSLREFFSSSNLLCKVFLLTIISVVGNQLYFAIPYSVENFLGANFYLSYVLQSVVEAPATLLNLLLLNKYGRILPLSASLLLSGVCCLLTWPIEGYGPWGAVILAALSRFFVCTAVAITEQLGGELFPTVARGTGLGVSYLVSSVASVSTQYIVYSSHVWEILPMLIMGSFTLVAGVLALFLPETMGKSMPDTVPQAESQGAVGCKAFREHFQRVFKCNRGLLKKTEYDIVVTKA